MRWRFESKPSSARPRGCFRISLLGLSVLLARASRLFSGLAVPLRSRRPENACHMLRVDHRHDPLSKSIGRNKKGREFNPTFRSPHGHADTSARQRRRWHSNGSKAAGRVFARATVLLKLVADFLTVIQRMHACTLNGRDVDEDISPAVIRLDKTKALGCVEPFHCSCGHTPYLSIAISCFRRAECEAIPSDRC